MIHIALPDTFQLQYALAQFSPAQLRDLVLALQWKLVGGESENKYVLM